MLTLGIGTTKDFDMAFHYYFITSQQGHQRSIDRIDQLMIDYDDEQMKIWIDRSTEISLETTEEPTVNKQTNTFDSINQQMATITHCNDLLILLVRTQFYPRNNPSKLHRKAPYLHLGSRSLTKH